MKVIQTRHGRQTNRTTSKTLTDESVINGMAVLDGADSAVVTLWLGNTSDDATERVTLSLHLSEEETVKLIATLNEKLASASEMREKNKKRLTQR